jgi:hypothetical protein
LVLTACAKKPPADFAPDPGLVSRITELRIEVPAIVCPGQTISADYVAVLDDGSELPFATSYDEDHPPALHIVFLSRYSTAATPLGNGNWSASPDPLPPWMSSAQASCRRNRMCSGGRRSASTRTRITRCVHRRRRPRRRRGANDVAVA